LEEGGGVVRSRRVNLVSLLAVSAVFFLAFPVCSVHASSLSFNIGTIFNGTAVPANSAPWVNATFTDLSAGQVKLSIVANGLTANEKIGELYFNLDPLLVPTDLAFSVTAMGGAFEDPVISKGINLFKSDGDGYYDVMISFNTDGQQKAFNGGDTLEYTISLPSLTANSFDFISAHDGGAGQYKAVAHLMGLVPAPDAPDSTSSWATVPEPATISLLAIGAAALLRRKRR
jgi:hypothetical protein